MWRVLLRAVFLSAAAVAVSAVSVFAQEKGAITGVVTDATGGV